MKQTNRSKKEVLDLLNEFLSKKEDKEIVRIFVAVLINSQKVITPEIKEFLSALGFAFTSLGQNPERAINSREVKEGFCGYDLAVGIAAQAADKGKRRHFAYTYNFANGGGSND